MSTDEEPIVARLPEHLQPEALTAQGAPFAQAAPSAPGAPTAQAAPSAPGAPRGKSLVRRFKLSEPRRPYTFDGTVFYEGLRLNVNLPDDAEFAAIQAEYKYIEDQVTKALAEPDGHANVMEVRAAHWMPFYRGFIAKWWVGMDDHAIDDAEKFDYQYADLLGIYALILGKAREGYVAINFSSGS